VPAALNALPEHLRSHLKITQQCRAPDVEMVDAAYRASGIDAEVGKFFNDLPRRMADAHLVIARSGASTLSELTVIGRPALLIPYPHAMDDHQAANAAVLEKAGAAWVVAERDLDVPKLAGLLERILSEPDALRARAQAAHALGRVDAAQRLADLAEELAP
jgi:UDP-N-acetylglucosamine--N-acetylmuramyl-(pentapeptide) pyrophosphoryl-undecaprenol N-acetylglucosamine transferase